MCRAASNLAVLPVAACVPAAPKPGAWALPSLPAPAPPPVAPNLPLPLCVSSQGN